MLNSSNTAGGQIKNALLNEVFLPGYFFYSGAESPFKIALAGNGSFFCIFLNNDGDSAAFICGSKVGEAFKWFTLFKGQFHQQVTCTAGMICYFHNLAFHFCIVFYDGYHNFLFSSSIIQPFGNGS